MKKSIVLFALAFLFVGFSQTQAQLVKVTNDNGQPFNWEFDSVLQYDASVISAKDVENLKTIYNGIVFFESSVTFFFKGTSVAADYTWQSQTLKLSNLESSSENGKKYIEYLNSYTLTLDHTGVNDGKHFRLNFWNDANGGKIPYFSLKFIR
jgi:hypothetical protein